MDDLISRKAVLKAINNMVKECDSVYVTSALRNLEVIVADVPSAQPKKRTEKRTETHACDLISRQAAIDAMKSISDSICEQQAIDALCELPSAQPEIIQCKDCKHWREGTVYSYCDRLYGMGVLDTYDYMVAEDDYCSYAERRTDES